MEPIVFITKLRSVSDEPGATWLECKTREPYYDATGAICALRNESEWKAVECVSEVK